MKQIEKLRCPCCNFKTLDAESSIFDICPICYWENDNIQLAKPSYRGGANDINLDEARENYKNIGAISSEYLTYVRLPLENEK